MLGALWNLIGAEFTIFTLLFGVMVTLLVATIVIAVVLHLITHIAPDSKIAKWINKYVSITITKS